MNNNEVQYNQDPEFTLSKLNETRTLLEKVSHDAAVKITKLEVQRNELLEALEALVLDESKEYIPTRLWNAARIAIAKAKGE